MLKKYTHTTCTEIGEKKVKLGGVMEASGLGGNCFKSMLMEISEFQKTQDHYAKKRWSIRWF